ncbi:MULTISPECIES: hypothetical protein [unclassified Clostridium]|uniref:hypothetical protein n=1 Tax=unclassified Clostridium TaxID=2614128 RepID=UPI00189C2579|nr:MULTISPECIES: hypothetical protein [unclassified Clostridium]MCR1950796.1 hypothetical protein [Clostridium sp. DSM 100503]
MFNKRRMFYRYIGSGSARRVFDLGNGYVIKIAKNEAGIAQNKVEYQISSIDSSDLFAKVKEASYNFDYLIMQKADKINNIKDILYYFNVRSIDELFSLRELQNIVYRYNLLANDLCRTSSWGIVNGEPVIIDYGFTREVRARYY